MKLTIEISQDEFLPYQEKAAKNLSEKMDIPGFRKGMAPLDVVKNQAGEMAVLQEAAQLAVETKLPEAIKQEELETVGQPSIEIDKLAPDNPFVFAATLPLVPQVTIGDLNQLDVKKEEVQVFEEDVNKVIENLRDMRATETRADRPAEEGDKVEISFNVYLDNVPVDGGQSESYPMVIGQGQMIPGFEEKLVGMKEGEEKEFTLSFPEDYHNKQLAGKDADFKVTMKGVYDREKPELSAELANEVGGYESVDALKDAIEKNLHEEQQQKADNEYERKLIEGVIEISEFSEIPEVMVNRETQQMISELEQNVAKQGLQFEDYLKHLNKDRQQLMLDFAPDAVKRIKSALILRQVAKQHDIQPSEEDIEAEMNKQKEAYKDVEHVQEHLNSQEYRDYVTTILRNKKTIEYIKDHAS